MGEIIVSFYLAPLMILFVDGLIAMGRPFNLAAMVELLPGLGFMVCPPRFICLLLFPAVFAAACLVRRLSRIYQEQNNLLGGQRQAGFASKEYESMKERVAALRGWHHDMQSHLETVFGLIEGGEGKLASAYIVGILGEMEAGIGLVNSGDPILDAIISNKAMRAKNAEIHFDYRIHTEYVIPLSPGEMTSMLGNILDNAVEAAIQVTDKAGRYIFLEIKSVNLMLHIVEENSCGTGPLRAGEGFKSTKGSGHGTGLGQIERIAKKYGGFVSYETSDSHFKISVYLPAVQEGK